MHKDDGGDGAEGIDIPEKDQKPDEKPKAENPSDEATGAETKKEDAGSKVEAVA